MFKIMATIVMTLLAVLTVLFAVMNASPVELDYYFGKLSAPLSLVIVLSLVLGAFLGVMASLGAILRLKKESSRLKKDVEVAEKEISNLRKLPLKE